MYIGPAIIQQSHQQAAAATTLTWTPTVTAGNRIVVLTARSSSNTSSVSSITDSQGNTYTQHVSQGQNSRLCDVWSAVMSSSGSNTITAVYTAAHNWHASFLELEACVLDTFSSFGNSSNSTTVYTAAAGEIDTQPNALLLSVFAANAGTGTVSPASGFTLLASTTGGNHCFGVQVKQSEAGETDQRCLFTLATQRLGPGAAISFVNAPTTYSETGSGGEVAGGSAEVAKTCQLTGIGGSEAGGVAEVHVTGNISAAGGAVTGGSALLNTAVHLVGEGGVVLGGSADYGMGAVITNPCPCNVYHELASGGLSAGGSAVLVVEQIEGGVVAGGSAIVSVVGEGRAYDGLLACFPLDEESSPYLDRVSGISATGQATQDSGVACLPSQLFDISDGIDLPVSVLPGNHEFSVSCWVRLDTSYRQVVFVADSHFVLGTSYVNHLAARIRLVDDDGEQTVWAVSEQQLARDRWYHVAASWSPGKSLKLWIDGTLQGTTETPQRDTGILTDRPRIGRLSGQALVGNLQEVRYFPEARDSAYWQAERANFCAAGFVVVSDVS